MRPELPSKKRVYSKYITGRERYFWPELWVKLSSATIQRSINIDLPDSMGTKTLIQARLSCLAR